MYLIFSLFGSVVASFSNFLPSTETWEEAGGNYSLREDCGFETQKNLNYFPSLLLRHLNAVTGLVLHIV